MNTPTPRTDAEVNNRPRTIQQFMGDSLRDALVPSNFARTLERELTTATEQLTKANETIGTMIDQIGMLQLKDKATTEQRDSLAEALRIMADGTSCRKLAHSADWNRRRVEMLSRLQKHMRDPERTLVCDILANGQLLPDPHGKRYGFAATGNEHICSPNAEVRHGAKDADLD